MKKICKIDNCDNPIKAKNLCSKHYKRLTTHDDTSVNFKAYYKWRKNERLESLIENEKIKLSYDEHETLRSLFNECVCLDEFGHSYIERGINGSFFFLKPYETDFKIKLDTEIIDFNSCDFYELSKNNFTKNELEEIFNL